MELLRDFLNTWCWHGQSWSAFYGVAGYSICINPTDCKVSDLGGNFVKIPVYYDEVKSMYHLGTWGVDDITRLVAILETKQNEAREDNAVNLLARI